MAIGRAIVRDPKVFLCDEPLSNLDASLRAEMRLEITDLHGRLDATMIYVTHDQVEAMTMADQIVVLQGGRIEQASAPMDLYLYRHPSRRSSWASFGSPKMNLFTGEAARALGAQTCGIRPEHVVLSPDAGLWRGRVRHVERLGADAVVHLDVPQLGELVARTAGETTIAPGAEVWASPADGAAHRFAA